MTGNVTQAVLDALDAIVSPVGSEQRRVARERLVAVTEGKRIYRELPMPSPRIGTQPATRNCLQTFLAYDPHVRFLQGSHARG